MNKISARKRPTSAFIHFAHTSAFIVKQQPMYFGGACEKSGVQLIQSAGLIYWQRLWLCPLTMIHDSGALEYVDRR